jgi:phospholipid/cholesterol/gamma-HCH transport system substrate-binding protein
MKRSDNISWAQVKGGMFIIVALVFFAWGVLLMGEKTKYFVPKGDLSLIMADVGGLKIGAPVWLAGVEVGVVREIHFAQPKRTNEVEVVMEVERESLKKIGKDSVVTVKTRGLMGEKYVDITPSQFISDTPETRMYGTSGVKLDDVMAKAGTAFDQLNQIIGKMNEGQGTLGRFSKDPMLYDNLVRLTSELRVFVDATNRGEGSLGKLTRSGESYDRLMSILNRADSTLANIQNSQGTLTKLIYDRHLYDKLVALADKSNQAAEDMHTLNLKITSQEGSIGKLLADRELYDKGLAMIDRADRSVKSFEAITDRVNRGEGTVGKLLNEKELYEKLDLMVGDLDVLVKDIKANPKRYLKFSLF